MFEAVQFEPKVEALVRFVEETDPAVIIEQTITKLRNGTSPRDLVTANALAVVRSTELPPQHHGGPLHPVCGIHAVHHVHARLAAGADAELGYLPIVQHTALCNNHVNSPLMGPYVMPAIQPLAGTAGDIGSYHISDAVLTDGVAAAALQATEGVEATLGAFHKSLRALEAPAAEHYFLWLLEHLPVDAALDQLLPLAIERNAMDDHNFIFPVYSARALDALGSQWASVLLRPAVRYQARRPSRLLRKTFEFADIEALLDTYKLLEIDIPAASSPAEAERIGELGFAMGRNKNYLDNVELMAEALGAGLSLEGAGEALSIGSAAAYLSTSYGNPMDSHLHTGTNNRRYLLGLEGVSVRNKLLALLTGFTGPEVLLAEPLLNWECNLEPVDGLPKRSQEQLLEAIGESVDAQPWLDWRQIGVAQTVAPDEVKHTVALARQYADLGYDANAYFYRLAEIACRDDFTEMHSLKHFQAIADEYAATRQPYRWLHLVAAAKSAAVTNVGKEHAVYHQTKELLAA